MKFNLQKVVVRKGNHTSGRKRASGKALDALFIDNTFYVEVDNNKIPIFINHEDLNKVYHVYAHPNNDKQTPWSIKMRHCLTTRTDITIKYWSIIRPKQKVKGKIIDDKFVLDIDYVNQKNAEYFKSKLKLKK